jgi:hypothetical protein
MIKGEIKKVSSFIVRTLKAKSHHTNLNKKLVGVKYNTECHGASNT